MRKVFVLDSQEKPLEPCSEARGRILIRKGKAEIFCKNPFIIKLKEKIMETQLHKISDASLCSKCIHAIHEGHKKENGEFYFNCKKKGEISLVIETCADFKEIASEEKKLEEYIEKDKINLSITRNVEFNEEFKKMLDNTFASKVIKTEWLEQGQIFSVEKDLDIPTISILSDPLKFEIASKGNRVFPPEFLITGKAKTPLDAINEVLWKENFLITNLLIKATDTYAKFNLKDKNKKNRLNNRIINLPPKISKEDLTQLQWRVERNRFIVDKFIVNQNAVKNLDVGDIFNPISSKDILVEGYLGDIWGINILKFLSDPMHCIRTQTWDKLNADDSIIIAVVCPEYLGKRAIRSFGFLENKEDEDYIAFILESLSIFNPLGIAGGFSDIFLEKKVKLNSIFVDVA